jgi:nucleoside-diphosphate-sugar epimerase
MKKILIIGYGDIAKRLCSKLNDDVYKVYGVSRSNTHDAENFISWDWLSDELPKLESSDYECVVFMPKPKSLDKYGYIDGFIKSSNNIFNLCRNISFKKFITISSTRVYGEKENNYLTEDKASPNEYRGDLILKYEDSQKERYAQKLVVLRFSGLYDSLAKDKPLNHLHRDNAAKIIKFFIEKDFNYLTPEVFNCSEDASMNVSNKKLKKAGFIFN